MEKKLVRSKSEAVVGGVAAGLAAYLGVDKVLVRIIWVMSLLLPLPPSFGWTLVIYVVMWAVLPENDEYYTVSSSEAKPLLNKEYFESKDGQQHSIRILGVIIALVGGYLLLDELVDWDEYNRYLWPVVLIGIGAYLVLRGKEGASTTSNSNSVTNNPVQHDEPSNPYQNTPSDDTKVNYYNKDEDDNVIS